jgi:hypothetical protein
MPFLFFAWFCGFRVSIFHVSGRSGSTGWCRLTDGDVRPDPREARPDAFPGPEGRYGVVAWHLSGGRVQGDASMRALARSADHPADPRYRCMAWSEFVARCIHRAPRGRACRLAQRGSVHWHAVCKYHLPLSEAGCRSALEQGNPSSDAKVCIGASRH